MYRLIQVLVLFLLASLIVGVSKCPPTPSPKPKNDATIESLTLQSPIEAGQKYQATVLISNVGTSSWSPGRHKLGSQSPMDNTDWGFSRVDLQKEVKPGEKIEFNFEVSRSSPGNYELCVQMLEELVEWFGTIKCENVVVQQTQKWQKIIKEAGLENFTGQAPFRGKYLGDCWSEYLESPHSLKETQRFTNITELGIYFGHQDFFKKYLNGQETIDQAMKVSSGPTFGIKTLTTYEALKIAEKSGTPVLLTLDTQANFWPQGYHDRNRCLNAGHTICPPLIRQGELDKVKKLYNDVLGYINDNFKDVVKYVWVENEACYKSYTVDQYRGLVDSVLPIIRKQMPGVKVGIDGDCENVNANGIDAVGFHFAIPPDSTDTLTQKIIDRTRLFKSRYRGKEVWMDEFGLGRTYDQFSSQGADRYQRGMRAHFDNGGTGVIYLSVGGNYKRSECGQECLYTTDQGEATKSIEAIRKVSRDYGIAW